MNIKKFENGLLSSNGYIVWNGDECAIVDAGVKPLFMNEFISAKGLKVKYIVLTHGHYDHAHYIGEYIKLYPGATPICHRDEIQVLRDPCANVSSLLGSSTSYDYSMTTVDNGDILSLGTLDFKVLNMPGHTPGCICLYEENAKAMFTGDVIFANGFGRTDFKLGDYSKMIDSLRQISKMDKSITIYPGHGESALLNSIF